MRLVVLMVGVVSCNYSKENDIIDKYLSHRLLDPMLKKVKSV